MTNVREMPKGPAIVYVDSESDMCIQLDIAPDDALVRISDRERAIVVALLQLALARMRACAPASMEARSSAR